MKRATIMPFSPYQSKLLRFAVSQYHKGMHRHRLAIRTARTAAVMGVAVTLLPVYAVVTAGKNASQRVGARQLGKLWTSRWLSGVKSSEANSQGAQWLDFSGFGSGFDARFERFSTSSNAFAASASQASSLAESRMERALVAIGACLSPAQINQLLTVDRDGSAMSDHRLEDTLPRSDTAVFEGLAIWRQRSAALSQRLRGWLNRLRGTSRLSPTQRITGVASDLKTRSLVLVRGYTTIWDGLTVIQQSQLQQTIDSLFTSTSPYPVVPSSPPSVIARPSYALARAVGSFWVEVLRLMAGLQKGYHAGCNPDLPSARDHLQQLRYQSQTTYGMVRVPKSGRLVSPDGLASSNVFVLDMRLDDGYNAAAGLIDGSTTKMIGGSVASSAAGLAQHQNAAEGGSHDWEATVIAIDYIEHP
ncbi:MAG: hypothetical protein HC800_20360 [Phormidesmis sp. RL_2_1]|nr:hypothetical protein [Phormidesmis sp. RL_2_1]